MSSAAAAADAPEEFAALADYAVDDFMSEAASDVEVFATTEGHGDVTRERRGDPLPGEGPAGARPRHEPRCPCSQRSRKAFLACLLTFVCLLAC